jgi:hypothetical protein
MTEVPQSELASQITTGAAVVWLIQYLKNANWFPWLRIDTDVLSRIVAVILAAASASGIIVAYGWANSTLTFSASGLTPEHAFQFLWKIATSLTIQELVYRTAVKKKQEPTFQADVNK